MKRVPKRRRFGDTSTLMLTSMTDMFTLILTFLLNFVDPNMSDDSMVHLPTAPVSEAAESALTLTITTESLMVGGQSLLVLVGGQIPEEAREGRLVLPLEAALKAASQTLPAGDEAPVLRVECDKSTPYRVLSDALYTAGQAGFGRFKFVVINGS